MTQPPSPSWLCEPQGIVCAAGHPLLFHKTGYRADLRDMSGHSFLQCDSCSPVTHFLAVFVREPSPIVHCYALSKESFDEWRSRSGRTPPTGELLYLARDPQGRSHFPNWRPPR